MTEEQAQSLVRVIEAAWDKTFTKEQRQIWRERLEKLDHEFASAAVVQLSEDKRFLPSIAEVRELTAKLAKDARRRSEVVEAICPTCRGDRFVVAALRPVEQTVWMKEKGIKPAPGTTIEEWAPCPDCGGHIDTGYQRYDGSYFRSPDPARVRQVMEPPPLDEAVSGGEVPEWVRVWMFMRGNGDMRELPQQEGHGGGVPISMEEYEEQRQAWIEAGKPTAWPTVKSLPGR
jgi:hypothetical protein